MSRVQGHIGADNTEKLREFVFQKESGGKGGYSNPGNQFGFIGGYQFGAAALEDVGYLKPGTSKIGNSALDNPNNWTIAGGKAAYLANPALQDQAFTKLIERNYRTLTSLGIIGPGSSTGDVAGYLAAAHLLGPSGVKNKGLNGTDANGTAGKTYFQGAKSATGDKSGLPPPSAAGSAPQSGSSQSGSTTGSSSGSSTPPPPALPPNRIQNTVTIGSSGIELESLPVPFPNPLGTFSSFNCVMTVSSISIESHRDPLNYYKAGNIGTVVARSAGTGDLGPQTAMTSTANPSGKYEFFIDNLNIDSIMSYNNQTKGSNAFDITFEIFEPYSMGIFLQACQIAAAENGWKTGYLNSTFLLTIEFVGYDESGTPFPLSRVSRHIPFIIKDIAMTTKASGAIYKVKGHPTNEVVLEDRYAKLQSDISISGKTVQEILQSGINSLQSVLNRRTKQIDKIKNGDASQAAVDEIIIIFPEINANSLPDINGNAASSNPGATQNPAAGTTQTTTITRPTGADNFVQLTETLNAIGRSVLDLNQNMPGESAITEQNRVQPDPKRPADRNLIVNKPETRQFTYNQGSTIINAITSVLLKSKYCIDTINDESKKDENGMIDWFRIETQVDFFPPQSKNNTDANAKLIIYKIVPYKVHSSLITLAGTTPTGYDKLKSEAAKVYDYIFTGNNTEILNLELDFPRAFFNTLVTADYGPLYDQAQLSNQQGAQGQAGSQPNIQGSPRTDNNSLVGVRENGSSLVSKATTGGTVARDYRSRIAEGFQRALYDSTTDLVNATMTIMGDPYYIADSGLGNFSNSGSGRFNVTADGAMDYQSGEVDVIINFRTPLDYDANTGIMDFGNSDVVQEFSGLFRVILVTHRISRGKFTQELKLLRRYKPSNTSEEEAQFLEDLAFERMWAAAIAGVENYWDLA
jgi:hypothetical protein